MDMLAAEARKDENICLERTGAQNMPRRFDRLTCLVSGRVRGWLKVNAAMGRRTDWTAGEETRRDDATQHGTHIPGHFVSLTDMRVDGVMPQTAAQASASVSCRLSSVGRSSSSTSLE